MKVFKREVDRYPDRSKYFLNFTITPWFNNRYKGVLASGDQKRIKKYKTMNPLDMVIEYPRAIFRDKGYFHATISARKSGIVFPDPKIAFTPYTRFISHIDPLRQFYHHPSIPLLITKTSLVSYVKGLDSFPTAATYYLTTIENEPNTYAVLIVQNGLSIDLDEVFDNVFKGYQFQDISGYALSPEDNEYPTSPGSTLDDLLVGEITLKDILLKEQVVKFKIFNTKTIKDLYTETDTQGARFDGAYKYDGTLYYDGVTR